MRRRPEVDPAALVAAAHDGDRRALARLLTCVESDHPALPQIMAAAAPHSSTATVIGLTGSPGVGKSTTTNALVIAYRRRGVRVGVLAVDPSSPFSGGALLGDRVRMQNHAHDEGVYIRSMASRGHLGGLSRATPQAVRIMAAGGCEVILVETVGVGQSEVEIAGLADTTIVLLAPGMGDGIQAAKAGILEVGDIFVVNKADREGAEATAREVRHMISLGGGPAPGAWRPPVVLAVAARGEGITEVLDAADAHLEHSRGSGELDQRRVRRATAEIEALALARLHRRLGDLTGRHGIPELAVRVATGRLDAYRAADEVLAHLT